MRILSLVMLSLLLPLLLSSCGSGADPIARELNELNDVEVEFFDVRIAGFNDLDIQVGDTVELEWLATGAYFFDVTFYLSDDDRVSSDDFVIIKEDCDDIFDECSNDSYITYSCDYFNDNSFDCGYSGQTLRNNNITPFLNQIPKDAFIIIEVCNDGRCDQQARAVTLF